MDYLYLFIASLFALSIGQVGSSVESCNKLSECGKGMNSASKNNQVEELCKKTEAAIACFKEHLPDCKIETFTKAFEGTMKQTELKAKEACSRTENDDVLVARFSPMRDEQREECERQFEACVTTEFLHASEHENYTRLCNAAPLVFSCTERVLEEECHHVPEDIRDKLRSYIDRLRRSVSPNCHDAAPGTVLSTFLLIGCLLLGKLGLLHTSG